jgi:hypothetical protein
MLIVLQDFGYKTKKYTLKKKKHRTNTNISFDICLFIKIHVQCVFPVVAVFFFPHCIENETTSVRFVCESETFFCDFFLSIKTYEKF